MKQIRVFLLSPILFTNLALAQPEIDFIKTFDHGAGEHFLDLYEVSTGGYILVGMINQTEGHERGNLYLVRSDEDGNEIWSNTYEAGRGGQGTSVIEADNGDFVVGCQSNDNFHALRVREDGELIWRRSYDTYKCNAVIELKNGNFMLAGDAGWCGRIVHIDGQGNVIWNRTYQQARRSVFYGLRETEGGVVAGGDGAPQINSPSYAWAIKVQIENGDPIWSHLFTENDISHYYGMTSSGDGGFVICGHWTDHSGTALLKFDSRGEEVWEVHGSDWGYQGWATGITRTPDGGYVITTDYFIDDPDEIRRPSSARFSSTGDLIWQEIYALDEDDRFAPGINRLHSVIVNRDNEFVAVGCVRTVHGDDVNFDGFLMKLERDTIGPRIIRYSPNDSNIAVLLNDIVEFIVVANSPYRGDIDYEWTLNDSSDGIEVRRDTLATVEFDSYGIDTVRCAVSDVDATVPITWHVTVTDLYVSAYTPDTLSLAVRRGESIDFSLDTVRAVPDDSIEYLWTRQNLDDPGEVDSAGTEPRATVPFFQSGHYRVDGTAYRGESSDVVSWDVTVRGAIWAFAPEELAFEVTHDSLVQFIVEPTFPDAEGQTIQWLIDGEVAAEDTIHFEWQFSSADSCRHHFVRVVVADSVETDTVTWDVTVVDPDFIGDEDAGQAGTLVLLSISPNPFNSTLTISFTHPGFGETRLRIYDLSGRVVAEFNGKWNMENGNAADRGGSAAERTFVWDASSVPAGVYFVRLQSGSEVATKKVVLMR